MIDLSINISPEGPLAGAAACNPWHLRCPSMPREERVPPAVRPAVHAFFPWDGRGGENALRAGPVYLLALSYRSQISRDGDDSDGARRRPCAYPRADAGGS